MADDNGNNGNGTTKTDDGNKPTGEKIFTQDDLNKHLANNKRELREKVETLTAELEALQGKSSANSKERAEFAAKIEELNSQLLTKDELAKKEQDKLKKQKEEEVSNIRAESQKWENKYKTTMINNAIISAANDAFNPGQVLAILSPTSKLDPIIENGEETGNYKVLVDLSITDKDGKQKKLTLSPAEAIKEMSESPEYFNLFKSAATGGVGKNTFSRGNTTTTAQKLAAENPQLYIKKRNEGKVNLVTGEVDMS